MALVKLTDEHLEERAKHINSHDAVQERRVDKQRWLMLNGAIKDVVKAAIKREFKKPESILELIERLIPLNIVEKIITKLANVYNEGPIRKPKIENQRDSELIEVVEEVMRLNQKQKEANKYFKLHKRNLQELFLTRDGVPAVRNLPRFTYEVFSNDPKQPEIADEIYKFLVISDDPKKQVIAVYTDQEHVIIDGNGNKLTDKMAQMDNPDGINDFGILPFVYTNTSSFSVNPVQDDDLVRMGIVIPLLLSDLAFAIKYLSWAVVYTVGASGDIPFSPNSIVHLEYGPNGEKPMIDTVKPDIQIDDVLRYVEFLVSVLLTTKNLSATTISGKLDVQSAASGVAKALDSAESQEDKKDQQSYFRSAEKELWEKIRVLWDIWRKNSMLRKDLMSYKFSEQFELSITFIEPKIVQSERDQIEISKLKVESGFSTTRRELQLQNPELEDDEIDQLVEEIWQEKMRRERLMNMGAILDDGEGHTHTGTGKAIATGSGKHYHVMTDGSGNTSEASDGPNHTHSKPNGNKTSGPIG